MERLFQLLICSYLFISALARAETIDDLVWRDGFFYKRYTDIPFSGYVDGLKRGNISNGLKYGEWVEYLESGELIHKSFFVDGKQEGLYVDYYSNGRVKQKGEYKTGRLEGRWDTYHPNGQKEYELGFKNNLLDGWAKRYYENGRLYSEGRYDRGDEEGVWLYYNEDGTIWELLSGRYRLGVKIEDYK